MSNLFITVERGQVASFIASKLAPLAVPSQQVRNDVANIQIDQVLVVENYDEHPAVQFKFDVAEGMGLEIRVKLTELAANPAAYMRDLLENLQGIRHAALQRRSGRRAEVAQVYRQMEAAR